MRQLKCGNAWQRLTVGGNQVPGKRNYLWAVPRSVLLYTPSSIPDSLPM